MGFSSPCKVVHNPIIMDFSRHQPPFSFWKYNAKVTSKYFSKHMQSAFSQCCRYEWSTYTRLHREWVDGDGFRYLGFSRSPQFIIPGNFRYGWQRSPSQNGHSQGNARKYISYAKYMLLLMHCDIFLFKYIFGCRYVPPLSPHHSPQVGTGKYMDQNICYRW